MYGKRHRLSIRKMTSKANVEHAHNAQQQHHPTIEKDSVRNVTQRASRAILSSQQVRAIFVSKPPNSSNQRSHASDLSKVYGVSPKTIRDIWIGRTWYRETCFLDRTKPVCSERLDKKIGRPMGAKDMRPRSKKRPTIFKSKQLPSYTMLDTPVALQGLAKSVSTSYKTKIDGHRFWPRSSTFLSRSSGSSYETCGVEFGMQPIDWAAYLLDNCASLPQFTDPFHDDWAFWPREDVDKS